jgi:hypothetical protein
MLKFKHFFGLIIVCLLFVSSLAAAQPTVWHNLPKTGTDVGDIFQLKFEISSTELANYSITLDLGDKFALLTGNETQTKEIPKNETRTYFFDIELLQKLDDGKYPIYYDVYIEDQNFKSDKVMIRIGEQAPGFELFGILAAISIVLLVFYKKKQ